MQDKIKWFVCLTLPIAAWLAPSGFWGIDGLTIVEQRVIAIFIFALLFWILEPIPIFSTSVIIIALELFVLSDRNFVLFQSAGEANFGAVMSYKEIMATFASPIIMLFLGGFFLAMAATKFQLDINLARVLLKPFGKKTPSVLFGFMLITAIFSMFMSNTATTAMMLAILSPVLQQFEVNDKGKTAFVLGVAFAANIGGMGTPIGTPPNAIAMKYLTEEMAIGFGQWMSFGVPFALGLMVIAWLLLLRLFKPQAKEISIGISGKFRKNWQALTVYATFIVTLLFWLFDALHGMTSYQVAMIPVAVFTATRIITPQDLKRISWDVLWLVAGGIALGLALDKTGLAQHIIQSIPFDTFPALAIVWIATVIAIVMATFMSNTATANLLMPIMAALGTALPGIAGIGGGKMIILAVAFSSSLAMALPISTPPNAMAHATGQLDTKQMLRAGAIIGLIGLLGVHFLMMLLNYTGVL